MKKTTAAILIGITALGAGFIWHLDHGISMFALTDYGDKNTNSHSNAEIRDAVSTVRKEFQDYEGCIMTKLKYSEELTQMELDPDISNGIWEDYDDIIVLDSTFTTSALASGTGWDGHTQRGWKWTVLHTADNGWQCYGGGRG